MTNREFSETNVEFKKACTKANFLECKRLGYTIWDKDLQLIVPTKRIVSPTVRQASKFRNKKGLAYIIGRR